jgi:preprotein translocase subunit SecG
MDSIFLITEFILAIILTIAIMLQKSSSIGLGAYSGSNESMFGAKGPANFLSRLTFIVGTAFVINTVALTYLYNAKNTTSVVDTATIPSAPAAPSAPQAPGQH